jgi:hypothetical protein
LARSETSETIDTVAASLLARGWNDRYSEKHLNERVLPELVSELNSEPRMEEALRLVDEMVAAYEGFSDVQIVWYPIENLRLGAGRVSIGDMALFALDDDAIEDAERRLRHVLAGSLNDAPTQESMLKIYRERWGEVLRGTPLAEIPVTARKEIAKERARERYDELLDFLNGAATLLSPWNARIRVGAPGEVAKGLETVLVISEPPEAFSMPSSHVGPWYPLDLSEKAIQTLEGKGFWEYTNVLATRPSERTSFEDALMLALHWYADCARQPKPATQLLSLTIAAETLFPRERGAIGLHCAESVAFVIHDDPTRRRETRDAFRRLYGLRSDIAHEGHLRVSTTDVVGLARLVIQAMLSLVARRDEFATSADLERWIDDRRLA